MNREGKGVLEPVPFITGFLCGVVFTLFMLLLLWVAFKPEVRVTTIYTLASTDGTAPTIVIMPIDVVELTKAFFSGLAALFSAVAVGYAMYSAARAKRAEIATFVAHQALTTLSSNVAQLEKNAGTFTDKVAEAAKEKLLAEVASGLIEEKKNNKVKG